MDVDVKKMGMKKSGYAPVDGLKLYYEIHGAPDAEHQFPLVLLHGGGDTIQTLFGKILPELARARQVHQSQALGSIQSRKSSGICFVFIWGTNNIGNAKDFRQILQALKAIEFP
jgi:pimeloyl-ACP methyl ester carboxylesterase